MSANYLGQNPDQMVAAIQNRFLYGLRRTEHGELFLGKLDQMDANSSIQINKPGDNTNDYDNFEEGSDLYEGRDVNHTIVYSNLNYEQYRWQDKNIWYYLARIIEYVTLPTATNLSCSSFTSTWTKENARLCLKRVGLATI